MCIDCGCATSDEGHFHPDHDHSHEHDGYGHDHGNHSTFSDRHSTTRRISLEQDVLAINDRLATKNRSFYQEKRVLPLNILSSPGTGKTTLIEQTILALERRSRAGRNSFPLAVIEGDQATTRDSDRIRQLGIPAIQINTGKGCHLDAHQIGHASRDLPLSPGMVLFIENIGNLVCPALFDLGESARVVLFSVTEGEDKPIKYPQMFGFANLILLTKTDLLPHLDFDREKALNYIRAINPEATILEVSSKSGDGLEEWIEWIDSLKKRVFDPVMTPDA